MRKIFYFILALLLLACCQRGETSRTLSHVDSLLRKNYFT